ncbi:hypothetical protein C1H46_039203 [Malus baccata]|uniref:Cation-transporting P-type ATPase N-terminal domain-containing protein n=1 Tax=Malus baccata TaxID=106549 RepID=A0A540KM16_MALBA|nr:hypothetical protein C1H46_039203 [Malus baccata]
MSQSRGSRADLEAGGSRSGDLDDESSSSPFDIARTKDASVDRLKRWRQAALVLNASRRFRYTLDLKKEEEKQQTLRKIRAHAQAIRAAYLFKEAGDQQVNGVVVPKPSSTGDFPIGQEELVPVTRDHNFTALQQYGGASPPHNLFCDLSWYINTVAYICSVVSLNQVTGLGDLLKTNLDKGIHGDDVDLLKRKNAFGSNTYPRKKARSFWRFLWEAWQDLTLIILMVAAVASLALGIKTEGIKEGWYDGGSIAFAVLLVIVVTAVSDYRQSLQFQNLNEEKRNIHLEVIRGGRRVEVSIYDLVVGDVVPLNIGNQVPADGILITGYSLSIDESSMTGESKIVRKDSKDPFLMSGCKVADGNGTMLVTSVGINTEWGMLMASISEDTGEETPLQVRLNGVATFIGIVGLTVAFLVLIVLLVRYFTGHTKDTTGKPQFTAGKTKFGDAIDGAIKIVTIAVTIVVVAVPEGLPLAVTLTLAYSMRKMMADKALVRRLSACETMGSATTICSDKTGTLTLNQMTVVEAFTGGRKIVLSGDKPDLSPMLSSLLIEGIAFNTNGSVYMPETGGDIEVSGSPTEKAILQLGIKLGMNFDVIRSESSLLHVFPFNSEKKRGGAAVKLAFYQVIVLLVLTFRGISILKLHGPNATTVKNTLIFNAFVLCQIFNEFNARKPDEFNIFRGITKNFLFMGIVAVTLVLQIIIVEFLGKFTKTKPLTWDLWLISSVIAFISWPLAVVGKLIPVPETPLHKYFTRMIPRRRNNPEAFYQVIVLLVLTFRGISILKLHGPNATTVKNTLIFNAFVLCQIFNEFNARKPDEFNIFRGITKNFLFMGIVAVTLVLQIIIVEFLGKFTKTKPLTWDLWLISSVIAFISWPLAVVGKLIPVPETPLHKYFTRMIPRRRNNPEVSQ